MNKSAVQKDRSAVTASALLAASFETSSSREKNNNFFFRNKERLFSTFFFPTVWRRDALPLITRDPKYTRKFIKLYNPIGVLLIFLGFLLLG